MSRGTVSPVRPTGAASPARQARREELVAAAAKVFLSDGYHAASVQDVADELGILKGSVYYYIDTKEDLLYEIARARMLALTAAARSDASAGLGSMQTLRAFLGAGIRDRLDHPAAFLVALRDWRALTGDRLEEIRAGRRRVVQFLRRQLDAGQDEGVVCPELDPLVGARSLSAMLVGICDAFVPGRYQSQVVADLYLDGMLASVACDARSHRPGHRAGLGALPAGFEVSTATSVNEMS